jgi:5-methyltetrahydropteroyltriglutamate--homocysteine methyltransferase
MRFESPAQENVVKTSTDRILTTHVGSLVRPPEIVAAMRAKANGQPLPDGDFAPTLTNAVGEIVKHQADIGIDIPSDGECSKINFAGYVTDRLSGFEERETPAGESPINNFGRDHEAFTDFYAEYDAAPISGGRMRVVCASPIEQVGQALIQRDIDNLRAATAAARVEEAFIPSVAPATVEGQRTNDFYATEEEYLFAIADAMRVEYKAIVDAGFILQIDDPRMVATYDLMNPAPSMTDYRKFAEMRVEAINHAIGDIPADRIRYHLCWGSWHGPHSTDLPLRDIVDIVLKVKAGALSFEAANARHEHEWTVWEDVKLPEGMVLIPGVVGHAANTVEHPELVAQRLTNFARLVGRENVIAGTDCGFSQGSLNPRVHASIMWAKLAALAEGAQIASKQLWR